MQQILEIGKLLLDKGPELITGAVVLFSGALVIASAIPGDQPDKFLQGAVDFLSKFSRKPAPKPGDKA